MPGLWYLYGNTSCYTSISLGEQETNAFFSAESLEYYVFQKKRGGDAILRVCLRRLMLRLYPPVNHKITMYHVPRLMTIFVRSRK